ncbi:MAG: branched-chain amino acid ABC transporter permease [Chloroflexi bacterium]|nr:branched-chain amino acid ABC transporter permease [Chloroflexota bacterium]
MKDVQGAGVRGQGAGVRSQEAGALKKLVRKLTAQWFSLALLAMALLLPVLVNKFYLGLLVEVFVLAVFALSYNLLLGYIGIISFGHAMFFGAGAYVAALTLVRIPWKNLTQSWALPRGPELFMSVVPLLVIVLGVLLITGLLGVLIGIVTLRVRGVYFAMVTLAFAEVLAILAASSELRPFTGGDEGLHDLPVPAWISPTAQRVLFYYLALAFLVSMYLLVRRIVNSPTGRVLIAIRENEQRAASIGYNPFQFKLIGIVVAGMIAGLAGALHALYLRNITPETTLGVGRTIEALLMTIIGGVGTLLGPVIGAIVNRLLGNFLADQPLFRTTWQLILGIGYILLVLFFPYGIVGTWQMRRLDVRGGWRRLVRLVKR